MDFRNRFGLMTKEGEEYCVDHKIDQTSENQIWDANSGNTENLINNASDRPRLIFVPLREMCGLLLWFNQFYLKIVSVLPSIFWSMTPQEMRDRIYVGTSCIKDPVTICLDGSKFDSTQHHT